ncbi:MAG: H+transporting two-sector ATPase subunit [Herbinix sp.]|jgi:V/A-type H+-transporting ATPase subunit K|nr:H+transporting two-sector ATPase subunit [Herbinix sp.]
MTINIVLITALLLSIIIPFGTFLYSKKTKGGYKAALGFNIFAFFSILIISNIMMFSGKVSAAEATETAALATDGWKFMAAALSTGLSCIGGGIAVASSASAALGAISEDSSIMGKSLIFVAMAEGVCLYGLIISLMILS